MLKVKREILSKALVLAQTCVEVKGTIPALQFALFEAKDGKLAIPNWLTPEQRRMIRRFYLNCPRGFHVDHVVPLRGRTVCGLHVPWNLQYLPARENLKKHNKLLAA